MGGRRALQRCCFSTFFNITTPAGQNALSFFTFHFFLLLFSLSSKCFPLDTFSHFTNFTNTVYFHSQFYKAVHPFLQYMLTLTQFSFNFLKKYICFAQYSSLLCLSERTFFLLLFFSFSHQHSLSHRCCRECTFWCPDLSTRGTINCNGLHLLPLSSNKGNPLISGHESIPETSTSIDEG